MYFFLKKKNLKASFFTDTDEDLYFTEIPSSFLSKILN